MLILIHRISNIRIFGRLFLEKGQEPRQSFYANSRSFRLRTRERELEG